MKANVTYRYYDSLTDNTGSVCQSFKQATEAYACSQYEQGGKVGPVACSESGAGNYVTIAAGADTGLLRCSVYFTEDCDPASESDWIESLEESQCREAFLGYSFAAFKCGISGSLSFACCDSCGPWTRR